MPCRVHDCLTNIHVISWLAGTDQQSVKILYVLVKVSMPFSNSMKYFQDSMEGNRIEGIDVVAGDGVLEPVAVDLPKLRSRSWMSQECIRLF